MQLFDFLITGNMSDGGGALMSYKLLVHKANLCLLMYESRENQNLGEHLKIYGMAYISVILCRTCLYHGVCVCHMT